MTPLGWIILIVGAVLFGALAQWVMRSDALPYRWIVTAIGTFVGAALASEWLFIDATPQYEGIAVWPALVGGLVVGVVVDLIAQYLGRHQLQGGAGRGAPVH